MRDFILHEMSKVNESYFKFKHDVESKQREKLDKKDLENIEKKVMEQAEMYLSIRAKTFSEKADIKKLKIYTNKQLENLYALI